LNTRTTPTKAGTGPLLAAGVRRAALFLLVATAVMLPLVSGSPKVSVHLLFLALGVTGAFFWALAMVFEREIVLPRAGLLPAAGVFLAVAIVSSLASDCPHDALVTVLTWIAYAAAFLLAFWIGRDARWRLLLTRAVCGIAVPIAMLAVLQYAFILDLWRAQIEANRQNALIQTGSREQDYFALRQRVVSKRAFSTFALPNSLAGFLLLTIPPTVGLAVALRRRWRWLLVAAVILVMLAGLFFTFSKGGWLAAAVVLLIFLAASGRHLLRRPVVLVAVLGGLVLLGAVLAAGVVWSPRLRKRIVTMGHELSGSAQVRTDYWRVAWAMWETRPLLGVGPGNYQNHYMRHKPVRTEETKNAHNNYVQLLAECGPAGVAAYLAFWGLLLARLFRRRRDAAPSAEPPPDRTAFWLVVAAGTLGPVAAGFFGRLLLPTDILWADLLILFSFPGLWAATFFALNGRTIQRRGVITAALGLGLLGFLLHAAIDLHLYVVGIGYAAFAAAGLVAAVVTPARVVRLRGRARVVALVLVAIAGLGLLAAMSRLSSAAALRSYGSAVLRPLALAPQGARRTRQDLGEAQRALERSRALNPLDHKAAADLANCYQYVYEFDPRRDPVHLRRAIEEWNDAVRLNPSFADYRAHLAKLLLAVARLAPELLERGAAAYAQQRSELGLPAPRRKRCTPALVESHRTTLLAPTKPQYQLLYGKALQAAGLAAPARAAFRQALELDDRARAEGAPDRQWLTGRERRRLEKALSGPGGRSP
jgi:O-antigen ligase